MRVHGLDGHVRSWPKPAGPFGTDHNPGLKQSLVRSDVVFVYGRFRPKNVDAAEGAPPPKSAEAERQRGLAVFCCCSPTVANLFRYVTCSS